MDKLMENITAFAIMYSPNVIAALLIFFIGKWIASMLSRVVERLLERSRINKTLALFIKNITFFGIMVFAVIMSLNKLGIETTSFIAIIGAAGLAVGLALQGSLSNFAAGVMVIMLQPFQVGDHIEAGGASGKVEEIQIFHTIMSSENKKIIVPNSKITADTITIHLDKKG